MFSKKEKKKEKSTSASVQVACSSCISRENHKSYTVRLLCWSTVTATKAGSDFLSWSCYFHRSSLDRLPCQTLYKLLFDRCKEAWDAPTLHPPSVPRSVFMAKFSCRIFGGECPTQSGSPEILTALQYVRWLYTFWWGGAEIWGGWLVEQAL